MIVTGFSYYITDTGTSTGRKLVSVNIVGRGDRTHVDALVAKAPDRLRAHVIEYFKPLAESQRPAKAGYYLVDAWMWWKEVTEILP